MKEWQPQIGERVFVRNSEAGNWESRIYLATIPQTHYPYCTVHSRYEDDFLEGEKVSTEHWVFMKKYEKQTLTKEQIADRLCLNVDDFDIVG